MRSDHAGDISDLPVIRSKFLNEEPPQSPIGHTNILGNPSLLGQVQGKGQKHFNRRFCLRRAIFWRSIDSKSLENSPKALGTLPLEYVFSL